jgi:hypothetical protein
MLPGTSCERKGCRAKHPVEFVSGIERGTMEGEFQQNLYKF